MYHMLVRKCIDSEKNYANLWKNQFLIHLGSTLSGCRRGGLLNVHILSLDVKQKACRLSMDLY